MTERLHLVLAGGGTAGHLVPGLAVAETILAHAPQTRVTVLGPGKPLERRLVDELGYDYETIAARPLSKHPGDALRSVAANVRGFYQAQRWLKESEAAVVIGLGGYGSVPTVRAARQLKIPYLLLEQ